MTILGTKDYSIFKKHHGNRDINASNIRKIISSIQAKNLLEFRPIIVNKSMQVIDGQHRLEAAKMLGIEIFYKIDENSSCEDILLLNINQRVWGLDDFFNYFLDLGKEDYDKFKQFCTKEKLATRQALRLMSKTHVSAMDDFKKGSFKFPEKEKHEELMKLLTNFNLVITTINTMKIDGRKVTMRDKFKDALIELLRIPDFELDIFKEKLIINLDKIRPCAGASEYLNMLKQIYNWKNRNPLE